MDWPTLHRMLGPHRHLLSSPDLRRSVEALTALNPMHSAPTILLGLLDEIDQAGVEETFRRQQEVHDRRTLVSAWLATTTWTEDRDFYLAHAESLTSEEAVQLLASSDDAAARQHLAMLHLIRAMPFDAVYVLVQDTGVAEEAVFDAIESGDLRRAEAIACAAPNLHNRPTTWGLLAAGPATSSVAARDRLPDRPRGSWAGKRHPAARARDPTPRAKSELPQSAWPRRTH
jgi:hypothetical protein